MTKISQFREEGETLAVVSVCDEMLRCEMRLAWPDKTRVRVTPKSGHVTATRLEFLLHIALIEIANQN